MADTQNNVIPFDRPSQVEAKLVRVISTSQDRHSGNARTSTPGDYLRTQFQARMAIAKSLENIESQIDLLRSVYGPLDYRVDLLAAVAVASMKHLLTALDGPEPPEQKIGA